MKSSNKNMKVHILLNWDNKSENFLLSDELIKLGYDVKLYSLTNFDPQLFKSDFGKIIIFLKYLLGAAKVSLNLENNDVVIGTNFHVGIMLSVLCQLMKKNNKIIALNIIANRKNGVKDKLRSFFYWLAFKNQNFYTTINSEYLLETYEKNLSISLPKDRILLLRDHYLRKHNNLNTNNKLNEKYIFTGGENSRDWETLFQSAELLPKYNFIGIARKRLFPDIKIPSNVKIIFDVEYDTFLKYLNGSKIVALPLNSYGPAGLLVLFDATFLDKPIIITETEITKNYVINNKTGVLVRMYDAIELANAIRNLYENENLCKDLVQNMREKLENEYSEKHFAEEISKIIQKVKNFR